MRIAEMARLSLNPPALDNSHKGLSAHFLGRGFATPTNLLALLYGLIARDCAFSPEPS